MATGRAPRRPQYQPSPADPDDTSVAEDDVHIGSFVDSSGEYVVVSRAVSDASHGLTDAEIEVGRLIADGHSNSSIAELRKTSTRTVANQVASLMRKLGVPSRHHVGQKIPPR